MEYRIEGLFEGRRIKPKVVEGDSVEALRADYEARGVTDLVITPLAPEAPVPPPPAPVPAPAAPAPPAPPPPGKAERAARARAEKEVRRAPRPATRARERDGRGVPHPSGRGLLRLLPLPGRGIRPAGLDRIPPDDGCEIDAGCAAWYAIEPAPGLGAATAPAGTAPPLRVELKKSTFARLLELTGIAIAAIFVIFLVIAASAIFSNPDRSKPAPVADYPDENSRIPYVPNDVVGYGRRSLDWQPGAICTILTAKGGAAPIVDVAVLPEWEKQMRAGDEFGIVDSALRDRWAMLQADTRVRVLGPGPAPGWTEVRVESGPEAGRVGIVMSHTLVGP